LRVHTTNDNTGSALRPTRNSAEQRVVVVLVWSTYSALNVRSCPEAPCRQTLRPASMCPNPRLTASI